MTDSESKLEFCMTSVATSCPTSNDRADRVAGILHPTSADTFSIAQKGPWSYE